MNKLDKKDLIDIILELDNNKDEKDSDLKKLISNLCKELFFIIDWYEAHVYPKACLGFSTRRMRSATNIIAKSFKEQDVSLYLGKNENLKFFLINIIYSFVPQIKRHALKDIIIKTFINPEYYNKWKKDSYNYADIETFWDKLK